MILFKPLKVQVFEKNESCWVIQYSTSTEACCVTKPLVKQLVSSHEREMVKQWAGIGKSVSFSSVVQEFFLAKESGLCYCY